jgi:hypothetical protein
MVKEKSSTIFFLVVIVVNYIFIKNFWFHSDDWYWFTTLTKNFDEILALRFDEIHLVAIPALVYKGILSIFGNNSYPFFQFALLAVNFGILVSLFKILRKETGLDSFFIMIIIAIWYTNSWGRENIRWPQATITNFSLLFFLLLFSIIRNKSNHLNFWVPTLTTASIFSSSWSFSYLPFMLGALLDLDANLKTKVKLTALLVIPSLLSLVYIYSRAESSLGSANYLNIATITILAPIFAFIAWAPWGSVDLYFVLNFVAKITIASLIVYQIIKQFQQERIFKKTRNKFTIIGLVASMFTFGFTIAVGRSSENILIPLSSRFTFILTLLFLLIFLLLFNNNLIEFSKFTSTKIVISCLLVLQIVLLSRDLSADIKREGWERVEFNEVSELKNSGGLVPKKCCNMHPGVDQDTYQNIFTLLNH